MHGCALLYLFSLAYLLVQPPRAARNALRFVDPSLGVRPAENYAVYAGDCRIYASDHPDGPFANVLDVLFDRFVLAHFFGWFAKAILLRDWRLIVVSSLLWEILGE